MYVDKSNSHFKKEKKAEPATVFIVVSVRESEHDTERADQRPTMTARLSVKNSAASGCGFQSHVCSGEATQRLRCEHRLGSPPTWVPSEALLLRSWGGEGVRFRQVISCSELPVFPP